MSGRYERIRSHDADNLSSLGSTATTPRSPPPSFHSRASSMRPIENDQVDQHLADAFDAADESDDDDEGDDRERLVRRNSATTTVPDVAPAAVTSRTVGATGTTASSRVYGGGIQSDGVFSNLTAKPERSEGEKEEQPPTYEQAAADAVPPYWETTILAPGLGGFDEVYIDGMPVGSFFSFVWNGMISMSFQLVGFLLTYLLHSTHAAKNGSRAGLGVTLIQYGFYMKSTAVVGGGVGQHAADNTYADPPDPNAHDFDPGNVRQDGGGGTMADIAGGEWASYILMIVGWFILIRAVSDYVKARRHEQLVRQSPDRGLGIPIIADGEHVETVV